MSRAKSIAAVALILVIVSCGPSLKQIYISDQAVQSEREKQREIAFDALVKRQKRLYEVSFPLLAAAASMNIDDSKPTCGFMLVTKDAHNKEYRDVAQRHFNFQDDNPLIFFVHPKFPAAKAGLKPGDRLINYNGNVLTGKSLKEAMNILQENPPPQDQPATLIVGRDGQVLEIKIEAIPCCKYLVGLVPADQINAASDGKNIAVTSGLIRVAENDDELALVVAHEIAHNVLGHIRKKRGNIILGSIFDILILGATGVSTGGAFGKLGGAAYSKSFEFEADYAGLYIAARAGHDITGAANFWRRMATEHPKSMEKNFGASHPSTPERFVAMEKTIQEIKEKLRIGQPLIPETKEKRGGEGTGESKETGVSPEQ